MSSYKYFTTPVGICGFNHIVKEDPQYGGYSIQLFLNADDEDVKTFLSDLRATYNEAIAAEKEKNPKANVRELKIAEISERDPKDLQDQNLVKIQFKTSGAPRIFDAQGNPLDLKYNLRIGSKVQLEVSTRGYTYGNNSGLSLYLNNVYVKEMAQRQEEAPAGRSVNVKVADIGL